MKYLIENITYKTGITRTDGKYPNRIGSTVCIKSMPVVGEPLYFNYIKYNNGELVENHITRTSRVDDYDNYSKHGYLLIYTRNSIYYFKELEE
jgi:hypothetical protein